MTETTGFEEFVRMHATDLLRSATLLATGPDRGQELLQDTLAHLYPRWDKVAAADVPLAYVRRAMVNRLVSTSRIPRNREIAMAEPPERGHGADPADTVVRRDAVWHMLATLSERQRAAVVLRYFNDLPDEQIADILGCRVVTVRSVISRALAEMRRRDHLADLREKAGS